MSPRVTVGMSAVTVLVMLRLAIGRMPWSFRIVVIWIVAIALVAVHVVRTLDALQRLPTATPVESQSAVLAVSVGGFGMTSLALLMQYLLAH